MTIFPLYVDNMLLNISAPRINVNGLESYCTNSMQLHKYFVLCFHEYHLFKITYFLQERKKWIGLLGKNYLM